MLHHTSYLSFFYTHTFFVQKILHSKVRIFTQKASRQNSVNLLQFNTLYVKLHTVCKITHCAKLHTICNVCKTTHCYTLEIVYTHAVAIVADKYEVCVAHAANVDNVAHVENVANVDNVNNVANNANVDNV